MFCAAEGTKEMRELQKGVVPTDVAERSAELRPDVGGEVRESKTLSKLR
jgi:hypothetical protein